MWSVHTGRHRRSVFRRMHVVVALVIAGLLAIMLPKVFAPKAAADPGDWVANAQATDATELAATPSGVYALHCSSSDAKQEAGFYAATGGAQQYALPTTNPKVYPCDGQKAVGGDGALYGVTDADSTKIGMGKIGTWNVGGITSRCGGIRMQVPA